MPASPEFRHRLKSLLIAQEPTQADAAKKIGVTPSFLSQLLLGRYEPSRAFTAKVIKAYNLDRDEWERLAGFGDEPNSGENSSEAARAEQFRAPAGTYFDNAGHSVSLAFREDVLDVVRGRDYLDVAQATDIQPTLTALMFEGLIPPPRILLQFVGRLDLRTDQASQLYWSGRRRPWDPVIEWIEVMYGLIQQYGFGYLSWDLSGFFVTTTDKVSPDRILDTLEWLTPRQTLEAVERLETSARQGALFPDQRYNEKHFRTVQALARRFGLEGADEQTIFRAEAEFLGYLDDPKYTGSPLGQDATIPRESVDLDPNVR